MHYRRDIDGLRALAVLLVVFDHAGIPGFAGGFMGVDIFFVISGYLISGMVFEEIREGRFSLMGFYERRIRRIFPAFLSVVAACTVLAWLYLLPQDLLPFSHSAIAALFSASNFYFNEQMSYFAPAATLLPLLHTWSLGVEEQFYILFPLILLAQARWWPGKGRTALLIAVLCLASFGTSVYAIESVKRWSFYWPQSRAWELLAGAVLALRLLPPVKHTLLRNGMTWAGIGLFLWAMLRYEKTVFFPGVAALLPVLGAAFILHAGKDGMATWIGRALAWKPLVGIGLISYSLYLWHWPVMVFYRYISLIDEKPFTPWEQVGLITLSLALAVLSWKYIEQPFRTAEGHRRFPRPRLFRCAGSVFFLLLAVAACIWVGGGFPSRFAAEENRFAAYTRKNEHFMADPCFLRGNPSTWRKNIGNMPACMRPDASKDRHFLLLGDSHAGHLAQALKESYPELDIAYAASAACFLLRSPEPFPQGCMEYRRYFFDKHLPQHSGQTVILSLNWERYFALSDEDYLARLEESVAHIRKAGSEVVLLGQTPVYEADVPKLLALASRKSGRPDAAMARQRVEDAEKRMRAFAQQQQLRYLSLYEILCPGGNCPLQVQQGVPFYTDRGHLTEEGARALMLLLRQSGQFP